jgi:arsenate reductase (thioredoxin)
MKFILALAAVSLLSAQTPKKVVFVCEHGAAKSVIAATEFQRMATEKGLKFEIVSRGTEPDPQIAPGVRAGLRADGMDAGSSNPIKVTKQDLAGAAKVVSFGPDLSGLLPQGTKALNWSSTPAPSKDYRAARDHIRKQLEILMQDLQQRQ